ncbi:hypothetical protein HDU86_007331 [Geranomyces michiganensis]|nr:hypothetical protein HDU86_007331 [Geranomyces michiganensis]
MSVNAVAESSEPNALVDFAGKRSAESLLCLEDAVKEEDRAKKSRKLVDRQSPTDALLSWATANGANITGLVFKDPASTDDPACIRRAAFTNRHIAANSPIAVIPASLVLSESTARNSVVGAQLHEYLRVHSEELTQRGRDPYAPGLILLSAFMLFERFENPTSFWKPYLEALPSEYELPLCWSDVEVEELLKGTNLCHVVRERRKLLKRGLVMVREACGHLFANKSLHWKNFLWAYSAISSRAFPRAQSADADEREHVAEEALELCSGASELCLYPVLDMLNHRRGQRIEWRIEEGASVTFVALEEIACGAEVYNNYGAKGNENLLGNYGFVLDPNPEDYVKIALNIQDLDPCAVRKRMILARLMPNRLVHLLFQGDDEFKLPDDLMAVTRLMVMNPTEVSQAETFDGDALRSIVNPRNELLALNTLWQLLKRKTVELTQTALHNAKLETDRQRMARVYREGQASILKHNVKVCSSTADGFLRATFAVSLPNLAHPSMSLLTADSEHLPLCFRTSMELLFSMLKDDEADVLDEDTIICLALAHERLRGNASPWSNTLGQTITADSDVICEILG